MSSEKRLALFLILTLCSMFGIQYLIEVTGLVPPPPPKNAQAVAEARDEKKPDEVEKDN